MMLRKWEDLPQEMRTEEVRPYYDLLRKKQGSLLCKRLFDILASLVLRVLLSPVFLVLAIAIKLDSHGPVFYRQVRGPSTGVNSAFSSSAPWCRTLTASAVR